MSVACTICSSSRFSSDSAWPKRQDEEAGRGMREAPDGARLRTAWTALRAYFNEI